MTYMVYKIRKTMKQLIAIILTTFLLGSCCSEKETESIIIKTLENEKWYTGFVLKGHEMPLTDSFEHNFNQSWTYNQLQPIVLSTKGRYAYSEEGWDLSVMKGVVEISEN